MERRPATEVAANAAMEQYSGGDDDAFGDLYDALAPRLYGYLLRLARSRDRADDLLQQTFLHMHRARGTFAPGADVLPWAFAIGRRLAIDAIRREQRAGRVLSAAEPPDVASIAGPGTADELLHARETSRQLQSELDRLPESQRVAFELVKVEGLSLVQAAEVLGTTVSAVKLRTHRAYEALRGSIGDGPHDGGDGGT